MCQRQKFGEDLITLGTDLERLARLAYPESSHEIRDKIACAQFISALSNGYIKRTLQLKNKVSSLKTAVQRAMAVKVKVIQENNFSEEKRRCEEFRNFRRNGTKRYNGENGFRSGEFNFREKERGVMATEGAKERAKSRFKRGKPKNCSAREKEC